VPAKNGSADVGRFVVDGESDRSVHDILASYGGTADTAEKTRAEDFLRTALAGGPRRTKDVEEEAKQIHGMAKRALGRARGKLRIPAAQRPAGQPRNKDGPRAIQWRIALPEHEGDLADVGPGRQHASACQGAAVWRSGGLAGDQTANGRSLTHHHGAPASTDSQTASPPAPQEAGGLHQQPNGGECANARKFSDSGQPPKADRWPEGSAGADANPAA
jgi:hypothetical protein